MTRILAALSAAATLTGIVLQAAADAAVRFSDSLIAAQAKAPEFVPDAMTADPL